MSGEREIALKALLGMRKNGDWPDLFLKRHLSGADAKDAALTTNLTYGVLQNEKLIDFYIGHFSSIKLNKISPYVLEAMRLAVYQLLFLDKIPSSAAVNESLKLIKKQGNPRAASFANAVLRKLAEQKDSLPDIPKGDFGRYISIKYSQPRWLVERLTELLGTEGAESFFCESNKPQPGYIRVNTNKITVQEFEQAAFEQGISLMPVSHLEGAYSVNGMAAVLSSQLFAEGKCIIQDLASQLAVSVLDPRRGERLLDVCAAPGGKSIMASQLMENTGEIISNDIYPHKAALIAQNAAQYGCTNIKTSCKDMLLYSDEWQQGFEKIICDVPCSGLGVIRKKPDIRLKDPESIEGLPQLQLAILKNAAQYLKPGGALVYSTCTILPEENEQVAEAFVKGNSDFAFEAVEILGQSCAGYITLYPHIHQTDGFFIARIRRMK